ncbi:MAG: hypothetical protein B7X06_03955 [Verrucomicrobia bacterium 21-51-4]|nr:MAG: hypothetical protein B7X06_03955 [Verrucomicrobia bacterium 21-51-4]HQU09055.1 hypothetical protein [Opitutales bacterium]
MDSFLKNRPAESKSAGSLHSDTVFRPLSQTSPTLRTTVESFGQAQSIELEDIPVCGAQEHTTPKVQLLMEDGKVCRILVTCSCGQQLELECQY